MTDDKILSFPMCVIVFYDAVTIFDAYKNREREREKVEYVDKHNKTCCTYICNSNIIVIVKRN